MTTATAIESEQFVADLFRSAGYDIKVSLNNDPATTTPFDFFAERGNEYYAVQVRTSIAPSGARVNATTARHFRHLVLATSYPLPAHAERILWHHCLQYDTHKTYRYTSDRFVPIPNPLTHMLPPPIPKKYNRRGRPRIHPVKPVLICPTCRQALDKRRERKGTGFRLA